MGQDFMKICRALEIVLELAEQNTIDELDDPDQSVEQNLAIVTVEDWIVNNLDEED